MESQKEAKCLGFDLEVYYTGRRLELASNLLLLYKYTIFLEEMTVNPNFPCNYFSLSKLFFVVYIFLHKKSGPEKLLHE